MINSKLPKVCFDTEFGPIIAVVFTDRAPVTAKNFLSYVDAGLYQSSHFYRACRLDNDREPNIQIIQGGIDPTCIGAPLPPITHESTQMTGLRHLHSALSSVRWYPDKGNSEFFIVIGDSPCLDFGGSRQADGLGFAVFGAVVEGMDVVSRINSGFTVTCAYEFMKHQYLARSVFAPIARMS